MNSPGPKDIHSSSALTSPEVGVDPDLDGDGQAGPGPGLLHHVCHQLRGADEVSPIPFRHGPTEWGGGLES